MKHLISLSLKYIRRQKLRTVLTFMCIMLSAFILASICTYGSCTFDTVLSTEIANSGTWEVDVTSWLNETPDRSKAIKIAENHPVTDDYYYGRYTSLNFNTIYGLAFFEISDGKTVKRSSGISTFKSDGNQKLSADKYGEGPFSVKTDASADGVYVTELLRSMGYSKGDTVTITVRPARGVYDESSQVMKEIRAELKEKNGTEYTREDPEYDELSEELQKKAANSSIRSMLRKRLVSLRDMPLTDIVYGKPMDYTFRIAGFYTPSYMTDADDPFMVINSDGTNIDFTALKKKNDNFEDLELLNSDELKLRLIDNCDYDEALKELFTALGHDYNKEFYDSSRFNLGEHNTLLALEWKSPYAIYKTIPPIVVPMLLVLLISWFISRFVIDNAFEMAVQERSTHFAALRIMGASKAQIAFVVLIEALFYCITAVPLGIAIAVLLCRFSFKALIEAGLPNFRFSADPKLLAIGAALTVIAILISAYTSAMWASRKLSPAEALNFGKPKSRKKKLRRSKSKLNLSSSKFLKRYTKKNIKTSKSRFIVATITMGLGILMFTLTALMGSHIYRTLIDERFGEFYDMIILSYNTDDPDHPLEELDSCFGDSSIFSGYDVYTYDVAYLSDESIAAVKSSDLFAKKRANDPKALLIHAINEGRYNHFDMEKLTGMSYAEFIDTKGFIFNNCNLKTDPDTDKQKEVTPRSYRKLDTPLDITITEVDKSRESINITGNPTLSIIGVSSSPMYNALIVPIENISKLYNPSYDLELTVNGKENYPEAQKRFNSFADTASYSLAEDVYVGNTGALEFFKSIIRIVFIFLASIWLVGILSMINSVNTSVLNRSRELMMLRSVGMTRKQLRKSVILETLMFSSTAAVCGTIIGVAVFLMFVFFILENAYLLSIISIVVVVVLALTVNIIISVLAALPAIRSLGRVESIAQAANG